MASGLVVDGDVTYTLKNGVKHGKYVKHYSVPGTFCLREKFYKNGVKNGYSIYITGFFRGTSEYFYEECFYFNNSLYGQYKASRYLEGKEHVDSSFVQKYGNMERCNVEEFNLKQFNKFKNVMCGDSVQFIKSLGFNDYIAADLYDTLADLWWKHKNIRKKLFVL
jgi:hypothetical protein